MQIFNKKLFTDKIIREKIKKKHKLLKNLTYEEAEKFFDTVINFGIF